MKDLSQVDGNGIFDTREALRIVFFLRERHASIAGSIVEAVNRALDTLPANAIGMLASASGDWIDLNPEALRAAIHTRLLVENKGINGLFDLASDDDNIPRYTISYRGYDLDRPLFAHSAGRFEMTIARSVLPEVTADLERLADELACSLDITYGYMDFALLGDSPTLQSIARRYRGIDIADPGSVSDEMGDKAAGVYWTNYFKGKLLQAVGGAGALQAALPAGADIQALTGDVVKVRLGAQPSHGDVNRRETLADRVALARFLAGHGALHIPTRPIYFEDDDEGEDIDLQVAWHSRFLDSTEAAL